MVTSFFFSCKKEKQIDAIWYEVYFEREDSIGTYYPDESHILAINEDSTVNVIAGKNLTLQNIAVTTVEFLSPDSVMLSYQWGATINSHYKFSNGDTLIIDIFSTTVYDVPFPYNTTTSFFLKSGFNIYND
jgi:hypothetical protein